MAGIPSPRPSCLRARDPHEPHRAATPLELLYDLCFVVAIAQAATALHHGIGHGHGVQSAFAFVVVFFAIWWAWMGFCWFASAFDCDDAPYRIKVLVQMVGVLVLAAGVPRAAEHFDATLITLGYAIMRAGLLAQWLRVYRSVPDYRATAGRYLVGTLAVQLLWIAALWLPTHQWIYAWCALVPAELAVPVWAERARPTPWNAHHIAERYGLLTLIVLGESVLAATVAIQSAWAGGGRGELLPVVGAAPVILFSMWWLYFVRPHHDLLRSSRAAFVWGYGHAAVFAAAAAVGAGLSVAVDAAMHTTHVAAFWAGQALALPVAIYLVSLWLLVQRHHGHGLAFATATALVLAAPAAPLSPAIIAIVLVVLLVHVVRRPAGAQPAAV